MKECNCCGINKPQDKFGKDRSKHGQRKWYRRNTCTSCATRLRRYKITREELKELLKVDKCQICSEEFDKYMNVDHCHITGKVRGAICTRCNNVLGAVKDDETILYNLIKYLDESK